MCDYAHVSRRANLTDFSSFSLSFTSPPPLLHWCHYFGTIELQFQGETALHVLSSKTVTGRLEEEITLFYLCRQREIWKTYMCRCELLTFSCFPLIKPTHVKTRRCVRPFACSKQRSFARKKACCIPVRHRWIGEKEGRKEGRKRMFSGRVYAWPALWCDVFLKRTWRLFMFIYLRNCHGSFQ